jgi:hypothetical protein
VNPREMSTSDLLVIAWIQPFGAGHRNRPIISTPRNARRTCTACRAKGFALLRDEALSRLYTNSGARCLRSGTSTSMTWPSVRSRMICRQGLARLPGSVSAAAPHGAQPLPARPRAHGGAERPNLWLADRGLASRPNGIKVRLKGLGQTGASVPVADPLPGGVPNGNVAPTVMRCVANHPASRR